MTRRGGSERVGPGTGLLPNGRRARWQEASRQRRPRLLPNGIMEDDKGRRGALDGGYGGRRYLLRSLRFGRDDRMWAGAVAGGKLLPNGIMEGGSGRAGGGVVQSGRR